MRSNICRTIWVAAFLVAPAIASAAQYYKVTEIGGSNVTGLAVNNYNEVVGQVTVTLNSRYAFYWSAESGLVSLGGYSGWDINDAGQIAGNSARLQAAVWENGSWITLENRQDAYAINEQAQVTGLISSQPYIPGPYAPFRDDDIYSPGFIELPRPYDMASHGLDINNSGHVVADCGTTDGRLYVGVFYNAAGSPTILNSGANYDAHPLAINDNDQIVGYSQVTSSSAWFPAYWASPSRGVVSMGNLGTGTGFARAVNEAGQAVGQSSGLAFLWSQETGIKKLNDLIHPSLGINLTDATDINDIGSIVAIGTDALGVQHTYLLTPEPTAGLLLAAGGLLLRRRRIARPT